MGSLGQTSFFKRNRYFLYSFWKERVGQRPSQEKYPVKEFLRVSFGDCTLEHDFLAFIPVYDYISQTQTANSSP